MKNFFKKETLKKVPDVILTKEEIRSLKISQRSAKERNYKFKLSNAQFRHVISSNCFYCNSDTRLYSEGTTRNGIDRVDNKRDYESDNVISCCSVCNSMKSNMDHIEFLNHVNRITTDTNNHKVIIDTHGVDSIQAKSYFYFRGRYPSPNEALEFLKLNLVDKKEMIKYDFNHALQVFPQEYNIVRSQLRSIMSSFELKFFSKKKYYKMQTDEWNSLYFHKETT